MPSSSLLPEEQAELGRLLGIVVEQDKGFIPDSAYRLIHKLVPWPVVEVLIYEDVCRRCVCDEKVADSVTNLKLIASHPQLQGEHPFGYPISNIIACQAIGEVKERQDLKWFSDIPIDLIPLPQQHYMFLAYFQQWFREKGGSATIL